MFSTRDEPEPTRRNSASTLYTPSSQTSSQKEELSPLLGEPIDDYDRDIDAVAEEFLTEYAEMSEMFEQEQQSLEYEDEDETNDNEDEDEDEELHDRGQSHSGVPIILPRARFSGHCNVDTVKDGMLFKLRSTIYISDPVSS